jgi:hypothetical protein
MLASHNRRKLILISFFVVDSIVWAIFSFLRVSNMPIGDDPALPNSNWPLSVKILLQITRFIRLILDGIVLYFFIDMLRFYMKTLKEKMILREESVRAFHKFIFVWCILLAVLIFYISLYYMIDVNFLYSNNSNVTTNPFLRFVL